MKASPGSRSVFRAVVAWAVVSAGFPAAVFAQANPPARAAPEEARQEVEDDADPPGEPDPGATEPPAEGVEPRTDAPPDVADTGRADEAAEVETQPADPQGPAAPSATGGGAGEEVLFDPELDGAAGAREDETGREKASAGETEVIADPELEGAGASSIGTPMPTSYTEMRSFLATRVGVDVAWTVPTEEVVEATQVAQLELIHHPNDTVGVALGLRMRHVAAFLEDTDAPGGQSRFALDVAPVAGYADVLVTDGVHARAGYQILQLGRFDAFGATNFLAVYDLRSGPATIPDANHLAQPGLRLDLDPHESVTVTGIYVPFFTPHLFDPVGTDYSLPVASPPVAGADPAFQAALDRTLARALERSTAVGFSSGAMRAFAPDPDFLEPQGALRATLRGKAGELSGTVGTGLERLPSLRFSEEFLRDFGQTLRDAQAMLPLPSPAELVDELLEPSPLTVEYGRFYLASIAGATDVGPVQGGVEATYMIDRTLTAVPEGTCVTFQRRCVSNPERSDVVQLALRAEWLEGEDFVVVVETFGSRALDEPSVPGQRWAVVDGDGFLYGAGGGIRWSPEKTDLKFELGGAALSGPTVLVVPRAEYGLFQDLFVELGVVVVEGSRKPPELLDQSLGYAYDSVDQVFTGLRWVP